MAYVTRTQARAQPCPACGASVGARCVGARGRIRESVHRERMQSAAVATGAEPTRTLTLHADAPLYDGEGQLVGRVVGVEIDLHGEPRGTYGGERSGSAVLESEAVEGSASVLEADALGDGLEEPKLFEVPDLVAEVFECYRTTVPGKERSKLTRQTRAIIARALEVRDVDIVKRAIRGLAGSEHHREGGWLALQYAIGKVKVSEDVGDRIDMMAAKAPGRSAPAGGPQKLADLLPPGLDQAVKDMVYGDVGRVRMAIGSTHQPTIEAGLAAQARLRGRPAQAEVVIEAGKIAGWLRVGS